MSEKSNKLSKDFWNLWQNVEEHGNIQLGKGGGTRAPSRELCAPGSEHSSSKIQKTRNYGQMPQVPRILQTDIVHETHLHHEKAERLAATCMQDSCKSWEALLCKVGAAPSTPKILKLKHTTDCLHPENNVSAHGQMADTTIHLYIYFYILYTNLFHINLFQALPVWFTIYKKVPHTYNTSNSALLWHIVIYISDVIYCHFCWAI